MTNPPYDIGRCATKYIKLLDKQKLSAFIEEEKRQDPGTGVSNSANSQCLSYIVFFKKI
jgi:hypothetical protein